MTTRIDRRLVGSAVAVALFATLALTPAAPSEAASPSPQPHWSECYKDLGAEFGVTYECAQVAVPLDYSSPTGAAVQLAMVRLPAAGAESLGSIFLNPGGPGGSGVDFALFFGPAVGSYWGPEVRDAYDIVGFDPRGVGRSTALKCFGNLDQAVEAFPPIPFPLVEDEVALFEAGDALLARQCDQRGNKVVDHMSTANVARDLDLLREAVGDEKLKFVGLSYGSYLGVTYANLFPENVGSVVVDGVLDPLAWANVEGNIPFSTRLRSDQGAQETLDAFFALCEDAAEACPLYPNPAAKFDEVAQALLEAPIVVPDPFTGELFPLRYQDLIGLVLGGLYDPFVYPEVAAFLAAVHEAVPAEVASAYGALARRSELVNKRGFPNYPNLVEGFPAVACEDTVNPHDYGVWFDQGVAADATFGYFGRIWTWASSPCAQWPIEDEDAYRGPYTAGTANPVLVIGNLHDPATRYQGAQTVRALLPNSALLTVDAAGHTSLGLSFCAGHLTGQYLMDPGAADAIDGFECPPEFNPFLLDADSEVEGTGLGAIFRSKLMDEIAFRPMR